MLELRLTILHVVAREQIMKITMLGQHAAFHQCECNGKRTRTVYIYIYVNKAWPPGALFNSGIIIHVRGN